jgi:diguanylate cyclase (GGDEF)-like protein
LTFTASARRSGPAAGGIASATALDSPPGSAHVRSLAASSTDRSGTPVPGFPAPGERPGRLRPAVWLACCLGIVVAVGVADFLTGTDVALILFYLAPIGFGTWFVGLRGGVALSIASAAVSVAADAVHRLHAGGEGGLPVAILTWNGAVQLGTSLSLVLMLAALRSRLEGEELLARTDALTGIANRRAFFEAATLELERARRSGRPIALAYVDCDGFKDVNDRLGHAQGDALLVTAARTLRGATRAIDAVARLGGDEFGLLLPETSAAETEKLLGRLRGALLAAMAWQGWGVGFSIGAAVFVTAPASVDEMMARADELMYAAKREAKGSIRVGVFPAVPGADGSTGRAATP